MLSKRLKSKLLDLLIQYDEKDSGALTLKGIIEFTFHSLKEKIVDIMTEEGISNKVLVKIICLGQKAFELEIMSQNLTEWSDEDLIYGVTIIDIDGSKTSYLAIKDDYKQRYKRLRESLFHHIVCVYIEQILSNVFHTLPNNKINNMMKELGSSIVDAVLQNLTSEDIK